MDPNTLKSLQQIDFLLKAKKDVLSQAVVLPQKEDLQKNNEGQNPNIILNNNNQIRNLDGIVINNGNKDTQIPVFSTQKHKSDTKKVEKKSYIEKQADFQEKKRKQKTLRKIAGNVWEDKTLEDWPDNDFRLFCGDLGNEVNDEALSLAFRKYPSFQRARVIRDKKSGKTKGYGFISISDPQDYLKALSEMNGKYIGNRPIKVRKSSWKDRALFGGKYSGDKKKKLKV